MLRQCAPLTTTRTQSQLQLPPLILHPCAEDAARWESTSFEESEESSRHFLAERYAELRMLCFVGKDINRWLEQCVEFSSGDDSLAGAGLTEASFINLLLFDPPVQVVRKLHEWNVDRFQVIFSRALGLNAILTYPPAPDAVKEDLLRDLYRYADAMFDCRMKLQGTPETASRHLQFDLYASGEYSRLLETAWEDRDDE